MTTAGRSTRNRLLQVDALRGLAAIAVVLFHFSTRFQNLFTTARPPSFSVPWGHYGVNLFFIISGFVIFMTLERATRPMDFIVSRFSRLYPAYWASILLTFLVTRTLGLPMKVVDLTTALKNFVMFHGLFGVPHVDGVYWTLEVELLFYAGMLGLYCIGGLGKVHRVAIGLMLVRWVYFAAANIWGVDLPWTIWRVLILQYLPWFALGMAVYTLHRGEGSSKKMRREAYASAGLGFLTLAVQDSPGFAFLFLAFGVTVYGAATNRLGALKHRCWVWLGSISYPLYLLHENIGWSLMLWGQRVGVQADLAAALSLISVLGMSHLISRMIELPAMRLVRDWYKARRRVPDDQRR